MKVDQLKLKNFTVFSEAAFDFCPGVNVLIGANGTGKTHVLKALYSLIRAKEFDSEKGLDYKLSLFLTGCYRCEDAEPRHLIRRSANDNEKTQIAITRGRDRYLVTIYPKSMTERPFGYSMKEHSNNGESQPLCIPSSDVLSIYEGFIAAYEMRESAFDRTYYDLCKALSANPLKSLPTKSRTLIAAVEKAMGGGIVRKGDRFYLKSETGMTESHLIAEGYRKLAMIVYLIKNGAINEHSLLFWDEPEVNLNPVLVTKVAAVIRELAAMGVQVFVATHDYLLTSELSLAAEHKLKPVVPIRFFALSKSAPEEPVQVETGDVLADLQNNLIVQEFAAHFDREQEILHKAHK